MKLLAALGLILLTALPLAAQTNPTGTISGKVVDQQGLAVPGVTVTVQSPALQGTRTTTSSANGDYIFPFLPPGDYVVSYELTGFTTVKKEARVSLSQTVSLNAEMLVSGQSETVTVVGTTAGDFGQSSTAATSYKQDFIEKLPLPRTFQAAALLAPGTQASGPSGAITISGAASYENLFMVNGVVVQDNLRSTPFNLYIEDAVQETTTTTSSISAEFGRFAGGVVNSITKSGGNDLSGSFRVTFDNDKWIALTPYPNDRRTDDVIPTYEATLGGPILKDKLWFFGALRARNLTETRTTGFTNLNYPRELQEQRYEGKLTWALNSNHTFKGAFSQINSKENGNSFSTIMDLASLVNRETPQKLLSLNYTGILSPKFFLEAQYSLRQFTFVGSGSQYTDLVRGTLLLDQSRSNARFNSPTFCGVCDDEKRDNNNVVVKASYFLSTPGAGSHNLVFGADVFDDKRFSNNHQSGSDYRLYATSTIIRGSDIFPVFDRGSFIRWTPIFLGSEGNRFRTLSFFANDAWTLSKHWSLNVGARFDKNDGQDSLGNQVVKDSAVSPRLGVTFDPKGDGNWTVSAGYGKYVTAIANGIGDSGSAGGQPATIDFDYLGPNINTGNPSNPVSAADAITQVFNWFNANGGTNRPTRGTPAVPGVTAAVSGTLASPNVQEFTLGLSRKLGSRGAARVDGVWREYKDFYALQVDTTTGRNTDQFGKVYDFGYVVNTNDVERTYKGLNLQLSFKADDRLTLGGNYTLAEARGNFNAETGPNGPVTSTILQYPEYWDPAWSGGPSTTGSSVGSGGGPLGALAIDVRHRLRLWATWDLPVSQSLGRFTLGAIEQYNSGTPYGAVGVVDTRPYVTNPGYLTPPASVDYYFTARDAFRMEDLWRTDLSLNWSRRLGIRRAEVFFRGFVWNVFNRQGLTNFTDVGCGTGGCINTTVQTNRQVSSLTRFNPFTDTPVEGVNWRKGSTFGQPTSRYAYQTPRTYQFSVGFRF